jgi:hypothetical protein
MKPIALITATILGLTLATAQADQQFSALEGVNAEVMSSGEMDAVQGRNFDFYGMGLFDPALYGTLAGTDFYGMGLGNGLWDMAAANMAFDQAHANDPYIIANLWLQEAQALRAQGYTGPIASPPTFDELYPNQDYYNQLFSDYIRY